LIGTENEAIEAGSIAVARKKFQMSQNNDNLSDISDRIFWRIALVDGARGDGMGGVSWGVET
jgi:hypothetical protein